MTARPLTPTPLAIAYNDVYLEWMLGSGRGDHPTDPVRARLATELLLARFGGAGAAAAEAGGVRVLDPRGVPVERARAAIESIHDPEYVARVIDDGFSDEWWGERPELGLTAVAMFAGTMVLVDELVAGRVRVGFNPQGAKHHAARDRSSGFCVFNDMALAALELERQGLRPLYLDWDIHAGDGVQHLLADTAIPTLSIHGHSTFPFDPATIDVDAARAGRRHTRHDPERAIYNWALNDGDGDEQLRWALEEARAVIDAYQPGVILLAAGADGLVGSPLGTGTYTQAGFIAAAELVAELAARHSEGRVIVGGAGGYQPRTETPRTWANVVGVLHAGVPAGLAVDGSTAAAVVTEATR